MFLVALWWLGVALFDPPPFLLPGPERVAMSFWKQAQSLLYHAGITLSEIVLGLLLGIILGSLTRLIFFVLMPTTFGIDNTLLYIPNNIFSPDFDGFPTLISPLVGLAAFIIISNLTGGNKNTRERVRTEEREMPVYQR